MVLKKFVVVQVEGKIGNGGSGEKGDIGDGGEGEAGGRKVR
jgi:hypothetical protein